MTDEEGYVEAVLLFDADTAAVDHELTGDAFQALVAGEAELAQYAASVVRAVFVVVGAALSVRAMVFFTLKIDEDGRLEGSFNLPLRYLADNAGVGPDVGAGVIRLACRGQCPVPWHAVNLWEPIGEGEDGSIGLVQRAIWRNRLSLKPSGALDRVLDAPVELLEHNGTSTKVLESRLTETFGEEGRVDLEKLIRQHNDRLVQVSEKYRTELADQQQGYLDQIRSCRDEIRELKAALRHEQQKSRRLQALLRGEPG